MKTRLSRVIPAVAAATALAASGVAGIAQASQGADDPAGHVRHSGADDGARHHHRHHHHRRHHARQALDDHRGVEPGDDHGSGGHGADDPVGHA